MKQINKVPVLKRFYSDDLSKYNDFTHQINNAERLIDEVLDVHPELHQNGYGVGGCSDERYALGSSPWQVDRVKAIASWLEYVEPLKNVSDHTHSYSYKHIVEHAIGDYVGNGEFILAALVCGFKCSDQYNPSFNMSKKSVDALVSMYGTKA